MSPTLKQIQQLVNTLDSTDDSYGSPYDRGSADSYYRRPVRPHYYRSTEGFSAVRVEADGMSAEEIEAYKVGYRDNTLAADFKDWG